MAGPRKPRKPSQYSRRDAGATKIDMTPAPAPPPAAPTTREKRQRAPQRRPRGPSAIERVDVSYIHPDNTPDGQQLLELRARYDKKKARLAELGPHAGMELIREVSEIEDKMSKVEVRMGSQQLDDFMYMVRSGAVVAPHVDPRKCTELVDMSDALVSCIAAMSVNVGGHGYDLVPRLAPAKLESMKADPDPVKQQAALQLEQDIQAEKAYIDNFFMFCSSEVSFTELRERSTWDKESTGYSAWEIIDLENPDERGNDVAGFEHMRSWTVRMTPLDDPVDAYVWRLDEKGNWEKIEMPRRFRRVCQVVQGQFRWFKQFNDPRAVNKFNGAVARSDEEALYWEEKGELATRCLLFQIYHPRTPYGAPRWISAIPSAIGRRKAQEVDLLHFDNKAIPPMVVLVSGGELTPASFADLTERFNDMKGVDRYDEMLLLEALPEETATGTGGGATKTNVKLDFKPMVQVAEGRFKVYKEDARTDVRTTWRLPPIVTGLAEDYSFATADASMMVAEQQVFAPERGKEDFVINHMLFPQMGIVHWLFRSKAARSADESAQAELLDTANTGMAITPNEMREVIGPKLGKDLQPIREPWANQPAALTTLQSQAQAAASKFGGDPAGAPGAPGAPAAHSPPGVGAPPKPGVPKDPDLAAAKAKLDQLLNPGGGGGSGSVDTGVDVELEAAAHAGDGAAKPDGETDDATQKDMTDPGNGIGRRQPTIYRIKIPAAMLRGQTVVDGFVVASKELQEEIRKRYAIEKARMRAERGQAQPVIVDPSSPTPVLPDA